MERRTARAFWTALALLGGLSARSAAYWIGDAGAPIEQEAAPLSFLYDAAGRNVVDRSGETIPARVETRRFYIQKAVPAGEMFELRARLVPFTKRMVFEGTTFNPRIWGAGAGVRFSPPDKLGPVRFGATASWDWNFGARSRPSADDPTILKPFKSFEQHTDKFNWAEGLLAAGISVAAAERLSVYGGYSHLRSLLHLEIGGTKTNWINKHRNGGFAGFEVRFLDDLSLGFEGHWGNERAWGLSLNVGLGDSPRAGRRPTSPPPGRTK